MSMTVECPSCGTSDRLPADEPDSGRPTRCPWCGSRFSPIASTPNAPRRLLSNQTRVRILTLVRACFPIAIFGWLLGAPLLAIRLGLDVEGKGLGALFGFVGYGAGLVLLAIVVRGLGSLLYMTCPGLYPDGESEVWPTSDGPSPTLPGGHSGGGG